MVSFLFSLKISTGYSISVACMNWFYCIHFMWQTVGNKLGPLVTSRNDGTFIFILGNRDAPGTERIKKGGMGIWCIPNLYPVICFPHRILTGVMLFFRCCSSWCGCSSCSSFGCCGSCMSCSCCLSCWCCWFSCCCRCFCSCFFCCRCLCFCCFCCCCCWFCSADFVPCPFAADFALAFGPFPTRRGESFASFLFFFPILGVSFKTVTSRPPFTPEQKLLSSK